MHTYKVEWAQSLIKKFDYPYSSKAFSIIGEMYLSPQVLALPRQYFEKHCLIFLPLVVYKTRNDLEVSEHPLKQEYWFVSATWMGQALELHN